MEKTIEQLIKGASIEELEAEIRHHNHLYWDQNAPEISDYDYDRLVRRLQELAPGSPVLQELGPSEVGRIGETVTHEAPMLSLDKCYDDADLISWASKFKGDVMVTPKMDGIACSLRYDERGYLSLAATRGSGVAGDDITANARTIGEIPRRLRGGEGVEVRGEIYMRLSVFSGFSEQFSNPRNLAAGAIKHKDPKRCADYRLSFAAYDLLGSPAESEKDKLDHLQGFGFPPMEALLVGHDRLRDGYDHFAAARDSLDFEIDGVVFKANSVEEQQRLGATAHHPRFAIAYKFQGDSATTTLNAVEWSVARSGAITPVALIEPVTLSGASVGRASLHNAGFLQKLDLLNKPTGAQVVVTRRGGVIPKVEFVSKHAEKKGEGQTIIGFPGECPSCGGPVVHDGDFISCADPASCRHARIGAIAHYCAVVDMQGFGEKLLTQAYDAGLLRGLVDLYTLEVKELVKLERVGEKSASNLLEQVEEHRTMELATFLRALGIEELGKHVSGILQGTYGSLERVRQVTVEELAAIHTIGDIIAEKVVAGLAEKSELIDQLLEYVTLTTPQAAPASAAEDGEAAGLAGKSFVFTGKLLAFDRKQAQKRVKALGGEAPSGVTKTLTYLVVGDGAEGRQSSKLTKAQKYVAEGAPLKIISETEFLEMVGEV
jgi:DNA ligase (NAD+)